MQIDRRTREIGTARSCLMLALEPPGNVARDLASFRSSLFAESGEGSSLLLPEAAALAFVRPKRAAAPRWASARIALDEAWDGIEGGFSSGASVLSRGLFYLEIAGPLEALAARAAIIATRLNLAPFADAPIEACRGFFLRRSMKSEGAPGSPVIASPPGLSFRDCCLVLYSVRFGVDPFASAVWREMARSRRRTGPTRGPSGRKPR